MTHPDRLSRPALLLAALVAALVAGLPAPAGAVDGDLDSTFGTNGVTLQQIGLDTSVANDVAVLGDRIYATGITIGFSDADFWVGRFSAGGTYLGGTGVVFDQVQNGIDIGWSLAAAPGDKIVVAGTVAVSGPTSYIGVARLTSNLDLDSSFNGTGKVVLGFGGLEFTTPQVAVAGDGSVFVGVTFGSGSGTDRDFGLFKLDSSGAPDGTFGSFGFSSVAFDFGGGLRDLLSGIALQPDGKIVLAGSAEWSDPDYDFALARLLGNGSPDTGFGGYGTGRTFVGWDLVSPMTDQARTVALAPDGRIAVVGLASASPIPVGAVAMFAPSGNLLYAFNSGGKQTVQWIGCGGGDCSPFRNELTGAAFLGDGSLFVSGLAVVQQYVNGDLGVARLLPNGSFDAGFKGGGYYLYNNLSSGWDEAVATTLFGGRPVVTGQRDGVWELVRLQENLIFRDGFEVGSTGQWSSAAP